MVLTHQGRAERRLVMLKMSLLSKAGYSFFIVPLISWNTDGNQLMAVNGKNGRVSAALTVWWLHFKPVCCQTAVTVTV